MSRISRFEELAERLVEGTFARLFAGRLHPLDVANSLVRALEDHQAGSAEESPRAPSQLDVFVHPEDLAVLTQDQPDLESRLAGHVAELAAQAGMLLDADPVITVTADDAVVLHKVRVEARSTPQLAGEIGSTRGMRAQRVAAVETGATAPPNHPFIILDGHRHIDLVRPIVSVGRAVENDIIIEDPRVSRHHAQIRLRYGRHVLYDLGSAGGTQINGYPIQECVLHSGDIISFAGVQVIYGADPPSSIPAGGSENTPSVGQDLPPR